MAGVELSQTGLEASLTPTFIPKAIWVTLATVLDEFWKDSGSLQGAISDTVLSFVACAVQHYGNFGAAAALTFVSSFSSSEMLSKIAWCRSAASGFGRVRVRNSHFAALDDVLRGIAVPQNQFTYVN